MLDEAVNFGLAIMNWDRRLSLFVALLLTPVITRFITTWESWAALKQTGNAKTPPVVPYSIPIIGNMLEFGSSPMEFLGRMR